jgi:hypothetical protein
MADEPKKGEFREKVLLATFTLIGTLTGAMVNSCSSRQNAEALYRLQRQTDLRERTYSRLMGLKVATTQAVQSYLEARLSAETHYLSFKKGASQKDLERARSEKDRAEALLLRVTDLTRETFETLGDVRIGYPNDEDIVTKVQAIYGFRSATINRPDPKDFQSPADIDAKEAETRVWIQAYTNKHFAEPFEALLTTMQARLQKH